ncbi:MAG: S41 family peptidase [Desulfomonile tiedjei]|nr:S41 family peptidase [Desulfomonile tiedjei]
MAWVAVLALILTSDAGAREGVAQFFARSARDQGGARATRSTFDVAAFQEVIRLIKDNYVTQLSDESIYKNPLELLTMVLPPHCVEEIPSTADCTGRPETCFFGTLQAIAARCHFDRDELFRLTLQLILGELDPNSSFMDDAMVKEMAITTSGKFGGVGIMVSRKGGDYIVVSPLDGSTAYRAGIKAGDVMLEIDGVPVHGLPLLEVLRKVRGPVGSTMTATVRDGKSGDVRRVRLRRETVVIPPVRHAFLDDGIGYLRIVNFQATTAPEVEKALVLLLKEGGGHFNGLILDLRDNPGGLLEQAIQVADLFLSCGAITSLRGRNGQMSREFTAQPGAVLARVPIVVLINRGTASGAEILAGALQGKLGVVVMGEPSFGKASVQGVYPVPGGTALRLTTAHYYTAEGRDIEGRGLEPEMPLADPPDRQVNSLPGGEAKQIQADPWVKKAAEVLMSWGSRR